MNEVNICFFCLDSVKQMHLCDICIIEQRMSNYCFQLCYHCMEKHRKKHSEVTGLGNNIINDNKIDLDVYIARKGNFTEF
jgi:hypothetical protein